MNQYENARFLNSKAVLEHHELINFNNASLEELDKIKGVGPAIAARIIKFRNSLGGFTSMEQISEVRNLPDSVIQSIRNSAIVKDDFYKIKINQVDKQDLYKHAYINSSQAIILINYRMQHGPFRSIEDISKSRAFSDNELKRLVKYFDFSGG